MPIMAATTSADNSDGDEQQRPPSMSLSFDSGEVLQDLVEDDDSNYLTMNDRCVSRHLCSV